MIGSPGLRLSFAGAIVFYIGDLLIDRAGGEERKAIKGSSSEGNPTAIVLGAVKPLEEPEDAV